jgi:hypothetical protein
MTVASCFKLLLIASVALISAIDSENDETVHVLIYETFANGADASMLKQQIDGRINGLSTRVFGTGNSFQGYGDKFISVLPILKEMKNEELVVITDSRDVLVNNPYNDDMYSNVFVDEIKMAFEELTYSHANSVVVSAEAQCCVSALTHAVPGSFYNADGTRNQIACSSGKPDCLWNGNDKATPWEIFMKDLMLDRTAQDVHVYDDMYLNAGLIAGRAVDLVRVIESMKIEQSEDDQAVLTDYMYHHPEDIVLDYEQKIFGNNRAGVATLSKEDQCTFSMKDEDSRLHHTKTGTTPFFIHSPGGFYECHDSLSQILGVPTVQDGTQRQLWKEEKKCNYGNKWQNFLCKERQNAAPRSAPIKDLMELLKGK